MLVWLQGGEILVMMKMGKGLGNDYVAMDQ